MIPKKAVFDTVKGKLEAPYYSEHETGPYSPKNLSGDRWEIYERTFFPANSREQRVSVMQVLNRSEARLAVYANGYGVSVETSLPKLLYGNNLREVVRPDAALKVLKEFVCDFVDGPIPELLEMESLRVDYCHNFQVGSALPDYVKTLSQISFLKHRRLTDGYDGVEWLGGKNSGMMIRAYDKFHEILEKDKKRIPEARGLLRYEVETRKKGRFLQRRLKKNRLTFQDVLDPRVGYSVLTEILNRMCADFKFSSYDSALDILDQNFSYAKANRLRGLLERLQIHNLESVKEQTPHGTFYKDKADLRRVGLFPPADGDRELPGLTLPPFEELMRNAEVN